MNIAERRRPADADYVAPKHPVLLVYDLDQTEGKELPEELTRVSKFDGDWKQEWLDRTVENAHRSIIESASTSTR